MDQVSDKSLVLEYLIPKNMNGDFQHANVVYIKNILLKDPSVLLRPGETKYFFTEVRRDRRGKIRTRRTRHGRWSILPFKRRVYRTIKTILPAKKLRFKFESSNGDCQTDYEELEMCEYILDAQFETEYSLVRMNWKTDSKDKATESEESDKSSG